MKKSIVILVIILLVLAYASITPASSLKKSIIPADIEWVLHIDMDKYTNTHFNNLLMHEEDVLGIKEKTEMLSKFGFDPLEDLNGITLYGTGTEKTDVVVCVAGNINKEFLLGLLEKEASHKEIPYGKHTIYNWDRHQYGAFAADNLVLIAMSEVSMKSALDVIAGKKANITSSPLKSYIKGIPPDAFFISVVKDISSIVKRTKPIILKKISMASLTLAEKQNNLALNLNFTTETAQDANQVEDIIKGLIALADMQQENIESKVKLPEDINVSVDGNKVRIGIVYSSEELLKLLLGKGKLPFIPQGEFSPFT